MHLRRSLPALVAAALIIAPLTACTAFGPSSASDASTTGGSTALLDQALPEGEVQSGKQSSEPSSGADAAGESVIATGDLTLEIANPEDAVDRARAAVAEVGGTIESENLTRGGDGFSESASLTVRVPADRMDDAFEALTGLGEVVSQNRSSVDVTAQHVDLQARVDALQDSVTRLTQLMQGAASTSELIEAETALSQRQQDLDGLQAQLDALEDQVDQSTIFVTMTAPSTLPGGGPQNFWEGLVAGVGSLGAAGAGALVVIGVLLPWLVLGGAVAAIAWWIVRSVQRRRAHGRES